MSVECHGLTTPPRKRRDGPSGREQPRVKEVRRPPPRLEGEVAELQNVLRHGELNEAHLVTFHCCCVVTSATSFFCFFASTFFVAVVFARVSFLFCSFQGGDTTITLAVGGVCGGGAACVDAVSKGFGRCGRVGRLGYASRDRKEHSRHHHRFLFCLLLL